MATPCCCAWGCWNHRGNRIGTLGPMGSTVCSPPISHHTPRSHDHCASHPTAVSPPSPTRHPHPTGHHHSASHPLPTRHRHCAIQHHPPRHPHAASRPHESCAQIVRRAEGGDSSEARREQPHGLCVDHHGAWRPCRTTGHWELRGQHKKDCPQPRAERAVTPRLLAVHRDAQRRSPQGSRWPIRCARPVGVGSTGVRATPGPQLCQPRQPRRLRRLFAETPAPRRATKVFGFCRRIRRIWPKGSRRLSGISRAGASLYPCIADALYVRRPRIQSPLRAATAFDR